MPVTVSLLDLVRVYGSKPVWPSEFRAFIDHIEADPEDMNNFLVAADWLKDMEEYVLEKAFRFVAKHGLRISNNHHYHGGWIIENTPSWLGKVEHGLGCGNDAPAGALADLGLRLQKVAEELS